MDRVYNGQNWFGWIPCWTGMQLDRMALGNYVWTEFLIDRFYNGQIWLERILSGQGYSWTEWYSEITFGQSL